MDHIVDHRTQEPEMSCSIFATGEFSFSARCCVSAIRREASRAYCAGVCIKLVAETRRGRSSGFVYHLESFVLSNRWSPRTVGHLESWVASDRLSLRPHGEISNRRGDEISPCGRNDTADRNDPACRIDSACRIDPACRNDPAGRNDPACRIDPAGRNDTASNGHFVPSRRAAAQAMIA